MYPTYGRAKAGRQARTYIQQLCEDTGCNPEDLLEAMSDREKWRERVRDIRAGGTTWWWLLKMVEIFYVWEIHKQTKSDEGQQPLTHFLYPCGDSIFRVSCFDPSTQPQNTLFQADAPEGSDTFQWPVIERDRVGGLRLIIWDKVKVPRCHYSDAPEENDLWTAWQLFPLDDD